jgi:hypothetical protein
MLRLRFLSTPQIDWHGTTIQNPTSAKSQALLFHLAMSGRSSASRRPTAPAMCRPYQTKLIQRIASRFQNVLGAAQQALSDLATPANLEYVWNIRGYAALLDHAHALLNATQKWLLVAIGRQEASALAEPWPKLMPVDWTLRARSRRLCSTRRLS